MAQIVSIPDPVYQVLERLAKAQGKTPEDLIVAWVNDQEHARQQVASSPEQRYYDTDDWLRHLGVSDERIRRAEEQAGAEMDAEA